MYRFVYKITLTEGELKNHFYYGKHTTNNLNDRYKGSGVILRDYYKKYPNGYILEKLYFFDNQKECDNKEYELIDINFDNPLCINKAKTSFGGNTWENISDEKEKERKQKMSEAQKKRWNNTSEEYKKEFGKKMSEIQKGKTLSSEHYNNLCNAMSKRKGIDTWMKGKKHKEESKKLISENNWTHNPKYKDKLKEMGEKISQRWKNHGHPKGMLGKHQSQEAKEKRSKYKWMYKDDKEICVHEDQIENYLNNGYHYGRPLSKIGGKNKGMKKMTNGIDTLFVKPNEFDNYLSNGYTFCYIPKHTSS